MDEQFAFVMKLRPGAVDEYVRLHSPVPDEVTRQLADAGITDYSIYVDDDRVFGVYRCGDLDRARAALSSDVSPQWTSAVVALTVDRRADPRSNMPLSLSRVFRFEG